MLRNLSRTATMDDSLLQKIIRYQFKNTDLLQEALSRGNKPLALLGDALISLDIAERGYEAGADTGADQLLSF
jgi:hypothetical protein